MPRHRDQLSARELKWVLRRLRNERDAARTLLWFDEMDCLTIELHDASIRSIRAEQRSQESAFARAIATEQQHQF
jgi:hypothetical protein